ncbi:MAG: OmpH family outer membrane protein [bacterium]
MRWYHKVGFFLLAALVFAAGGMILRLTTSVEAEGIKIGYVDPDEILKKFQPAVDAAGRLDTLKAQREKDLRDKVVEKFGTADVDKLPREKQLELNRLIEEAEKSFEGEVDKIRQDEWDPVVGKVREMIEKVSQEAGITIVLQKEVVLYGGTDLTEDVLKELTKQ